MWAWLKYWMDKLESRAFYHLCRLEDYYQTPVAVKFHEVRMDCPDMSMQELRQALLKILFHTFPQKHRKNGRNSPCQPTSRWWLNQPIWTNIRQMDHLPLLGSGYPSSCKCHKLLGKPGAVQRKPPNTKSLKKGTQGTYFTGPVNKHSTHGRMENVAVMRWALYTVEWVPFEFPNVIHVKIPPCKLQTSHIHLLHAKECEGMTTPVHGEIRDFQVFREYFFQRNRC